MLTFGEAEPEESIHTTIPDLAKKKLYSAEKSAFEFENHDPVDMWATQRDKENRQRLLQAFRHPDTKLSKKQREYQLDNLARQMKKPK